MKFVVVSEKTHARTITFDCSWSTNKEKEGRGKRKVEGLEIEEHAKQCIFFNNDHKFFMIEPSFLSFEEVYIDNKKYGAKYFASEFRNKNERRRKIFLTSYYVAKKIPFLLIDIVILPSFILK